MSRNMSAGANSYQVGGEHYQTGGMQHWDFFGPEYLAGCATKYVSRWRKKNGLQDLEKSLHYAEKLLECVRYPLRSNEHVAIAADIGKVGPWAKNAGLSWTETAIIYNLMQWGIPQNVEFAINGIRMLISAEKLAEDGRLGPKAEGVTTPMKLDPKAHEKYGMSMSERRVPRYPVQKDEPTVARTPADGGQHASLFPWYMTRRKYEETFAPGDRLRDADHFYHGMGADNVALDTYVEHSTIPRELQSCYTIVTNTQDGPSFWLINMGNVPPDLRDCYPRVQHEMNSKEYEEAPRWQKSLYYWSKDDQKWVLNHYSQSWGRDA